MFKKLISSLNVFGVASTASGSIKPDEELVLGASCPVPVTQQRVIMDKRVHERRSRPRCVQHTPSVRVDPKIYIDNGDGYVNKDDATDTISYEEAQALQAMPRRDIEETLPTELPKFQKERTQAMLMQTMR